MDPFVCGCIFPIVAIVVVADIFTRIGNSEWWGEFKPKIKKWLDKTLDELGWH
ncbi:MAG: hypothetical protein WAV05_10195 [Anaerolineales bacterium]